jgi:hypothetical protein
MLRQRLANGMFAALMYWRTEHPKMPVWCRITYGLRCQEEARYGAV